MDSSSPAKDDEFSNHDTEGESEADLEAPSSTHPSGNKRKQVPQGESSNPVLEAEEDVVSKKTRSDVWNSFTRLRDNEEKCKCNYCGKIMSCITTSSTSNLIKHLATCKQHQAWNSAKPKGTQQQSMTPTGEVQYLRVSEEVFREAANEMLVIGELPLAFVEGLAFRHFCNKCNLYKPHSRRTSTRDIVKYFVRRREAMKKIFLDSKQRVSLTTDIWVAPTTAQSYMVITAHFIDAIWKYRKLIIAFKHIENHRGATICSILLDTMKEWGIDKVFTITVDNATANTSALRRFTESFGSLSSDALVLSGEFLHMRCAAHILNFVVKDGLQEIDKSVTAIRNAVSYVRANSQRMKAFEAKVETGKKVSRGSLSLDCTTRWNSTYLMLNRALRFKDAFAKMMAEDKLYNDHFLEVDKKGNQRIGRATC